MDLKAFLHSMPVPDRESFAVRCGTSYGHLRNVAYGKPCAEKLAINIDRESGGVVTCESLCPDVDFGYLRGRTSQAAEEPRQPTSKTRPLPTSGRGANSEQATAGSEPIGDRVQSAACACLAGAKRTAGSDCQGVA